MGEGRGRKDSVSRMEVIRERDGLEMKDLVVKRVREPIKALEL